MSEFEAPLASSEDWAVFSDSPSKSNVPSIGESNATILGGRVNDDTFEEYMSGSLEDLVNTFDEKITKCFVNYNEETEKIAPVQIRSQEEFINGCQIWWNLTGNFGRPPPVDWTKSKARRLQLPTLNLKVYQDDHSTRNGHTENHVDDDEGTRELDLHSLLISSIPNVDDKVVVSVEDVLEEIDCMMMQEDVTHSPTIGSASSVVSKLSSMTKSADDCHTFSKLNPPAMTQNLRCLTTSQLNECYVELERIIQEYSSTLIQELARRDELEFEKEVKNTFISILLGIQNRKRQIHLDMKKGRSVPITKFLTTVIPFNPEMGPIDVACLQVLIKILQAINEDNPAVPTLLTDYILKVLCPNIHN